MKETDLALLERFTRSRDADAFSEIVGRYQNLVYSTCARILGDPVGAEDAAQECFMKLLRKADSVRSSLAGWLHRCATDISIDEARRRAVRKDKEKVSSQMNSSGNDEHAWHDVAPHLDKALEELPDDLRIVVVEYFLQRRTQTEIAEQLGVSPATVSRRIDSGIGELRKKLKKTGVIVSGALLASLVAEHAVSAAPATLTAALGKVAIAGAVKASGAPAAAAASAWVAKGTVAGALTAAAKAKIAAVVVAATVAVGATVGLALREKGPPVAAKPEPAHNSPREEPQEQPAAQPRPERPSFEIYAVVEPAHWSEAQMLPLGELCLAKEALLTAEGIASYDWDRHTVYLLPEAKKELSWSHGAPFVVVVNGRRCYFGIFWHPMTSFDPGWPLALKGDADSIYFWGIGRKGIDLSRKGRIYKALKALGKLAPDHTAWGEPVGGLQAGIRNYDRDPLLPYRVGEKVPLLLKVRNVGDEPIELAYSRNTPASVSLLSTVLDAEGGRLTPLSPVCNYKRWPVSKTLEPGDDLVLCDDTCALQPAGPDRLPSRSTTLVLPAAPGEHRVSYSYRLDDPKGLSLTTGTLEVEIAPPAIAAPGAATKEPSFSYTISTDKPAYVLGEPITLTCELKNRSLARQKIMKWDGPLAGPRTDLRGNFSFAVFHVTNGEQQRINRRRLTAEEPVGYLLLEPNESWRKTFVINDLFYKDERYLLRSTYFSHPDKKNPDAFEGMVHAKDVRIKVLKLDANGLKENRERLREGNRDAIRIADMHQDVDSIPLISALCSSRNAETRRLAHGALGSFHTEASYKALGRAVLLEPDHSRRIDITRIFSSRGDEAVVPYLKEMLKDKYSEAIDTGGKTYRLYPVRMWASYALKARGIRDDTQYLYELRAREPVKVSPLKGINLARLGVTSVRASSIRGNRAQDYRHYAVLTMFDGGRNIIHNMINYTHWEVSSLKPRCRVRLRFDVPVTIHSVRLEMPGKNWPRAYSIRIGRNTGNPTPVVTGGTIPIGETSLKHDLPEPARNVTQVEILFSRPRMTQAFRSKMIQAFGMQGGRDVEGLFYMIQKISVSEIQIDGEVPEGVDITPQNPRIARDDDLPPLVLVKGVNLARLGITRVRASSVYGNRAQDNKYHGVLNLFDGGRNIINNTNWADRLSWLSAAAPRHRVRLSFDKPVTVHSVLLDVLNRNMPAAYSIRISGKAGDRRKILFDSDPIPITLPSQKHDLARPVRNATEIELSFPGPKMIQVSEIQIDGEVAEGVDTTPQMPRIAKEDHQSL